MITIELTNESVEGEPGPSFYWQGQPGDFLKVINDIHKLGESDGHTINLNSINYVNILHEKRVILKSLKGGTNLCKVVNDSVSIELDSTIWREILHLMFSISFYPSHNYVEFDNLELIEDANFVISSEG